jgi:DNA invertase Pin-like site-specific DNA recombinase
MGHAVPRAAIYSRVSTTDQNTGLQVDEATALVHRRGWTLVEVFEDVGISGTKGRRPGLDRLLAAARKRKVDVLVVWRADRLFRSVHHMVTTLTDLSALGIDFTSVSESFDTSTPSGKLLFHISSAFAQFERDVSSSAPSLAWLPPAAGASAWGAQGFASTSMKYASSSIRGNHCGPSRRPSGSATARSIER